MKKIFVSLALCLILVAMVVSPAMAAAKKSVFTTYIAEDGVRVGGTTMGGYTIKTYRQLNVWHELTLYNPKAVPQLTDGNYPFYLVAGAAQKDVLKAYFLAKWGPGAYYDQIVLEINGTAPFFYIKAASGIYTMFDGFTYALSGGTVYANVRIDDDYPLAKYYYHGVLQNANGPLPFNIVLRVV